MDSMTGAVRQRSHAMPWAWLCAVVLLAGLFSPLSASADSDRADRTLVVGLYQNPPKVYRDAQQRPAGLFVDLLEGVADEQGWRLAYRDCQWNDCLAALAAGELELMPDVAATPARRDLFAFHRVPVTQAWSQLYRPAHVDLWSLEDLAALRVAVLEGSVQQAWFESRPELDVELILVSSMLAGFSAIDEGRADAAATNNFFGARFARVHGLAEAPITFDQQSLHFAAPLNADPTHLAAIDEALTRWKAETGSPFYRALERALVPEPVTAVPRWLEPLLLTLAVILVGLTSFVLLLRWRVRVRTQALESSRQQLQHVLDSSPVVLYRACPESLRPSWISPNVTSLLELAPEQLVSAAAWDERIVEEDRDKRTMAWSELHEAGRVALDYRIHDGAGKVRHLRDEMRLASLGHGDQEVIGTWLDLTAEVEQKERIRYLSNHDRLTRLPNRSVFYEQLETAISHAEFAGQGGIVMLIDLDRFGAVNETVGLAVGDQLLAAQARRLLAQVSSTDLVARSGNDEFCILLGTEGDPGCIDTLCRELLESIAEPVEMEGHQISVSASIGLARFPEHGKGASEVMAAAELALLQARRGGGNAWEMYQPALGGVTGNRMLLEQDIRRALEQDQFVLVFQPQYQLEGRRLVGFECLIRWQHPERGLIRPGAFIPLAEQTGQIRKIDLWVLDQACRQLARWHQAGLALPRLSVNLSALEFRSEQLASTIDQTLRRHGIPADRLEIEITETTLMEAPDQAAAVLNKLHQLGVYLSMDDFGTGYSNMAQLLALPLDQLKVDQSLLANLEKSSQKQSVLRAIIALASALGMELIAEGIEVPAQLKFLQREGCPMGQGYLLGRPMSADQAETLLRSG